MNILVGNIKDGSIAGFLDGERQQAFGEAKYNTLPQFCRNCEVRPMCNGECPKNRFIKTPDGEDGLNYLCEGYKYFFTHASLYKCCGGYGRISPDPKRIAH